MLNFSKNQMFVTALLLAVITSPVLAAKGDVYVGAGIGISEFDGYACEDVVCERDGDSGDILIGDDTAWQGFIGYGLSDSLSVELSYVDLGKGRDDDDASDKFSADIWALSVLGELPVSEHVSVYAKAGVTQWDVERSDSSSRHHDGGHGLTMGLGANVQLNEHLELRAGWDYFAEVGSQHRSTGGGGGDLEGVGESDISLVSLNVVYDFSPQAFNKSLSSLTGGNNGFYLGGGLGASDFDGWGNAGSDPIIGKPAAWRLFTGYEYDQFWAVEFGFADLGSGYEDDSTNPDTIEVKVMDVSLIRRLPISNRLDVFAKAGVTYWDFEFHNNDGSNYTIDDSGVGFVAGLGANYYLSNQLSVRAAWDYYGKMGSFDEEPTGFGTETVDVGEADVSFLSLNVVYSLSPMGRMAPSALKLADSYYYAGLGIAAVDHDGFIESTNYLTTDTTSQASWQAFVGYQFNPYLAAELSYASLGEAVEDEGDRDKHTSTATALSIVGSIPVTDRFKLTAKAGVTVWDAEQADGDSAGDKDSGNDATYGLGAEYALTKEISVRANWDYYSNIGIQRSENSDASGKADIEMTSINIVGKF